MLWNWIEGIWGTNYSRRRRQEARQGAVWTKKDRGEKEGMFATQTAALVPTPESLTKPQTRSWLIG